MDATLLLRHWAWVGLGGILTFMYLAYIRGCYAAATSLGMGGVGGILTFIYLAHIRGCYAAATSLGMGGVGGILTFMYLAYIGGCYAAATSLGMGGAGGDINVHVPCQHTWMLRCCEFLEHLEDLLPQDWCCQMRKREANPGIDNVVTSFQKSIKIIVSLRRKRHFGNFPMEFSHKKCIHLKLEKSPDKRTENQCWMILNLHFEPRPSMRRVPSSFH